MKGGKVMFNQIERKYKKDSKELSFNISYWVFSCIVIMAIVNWPYIIKIIIELVFALTFVFIYYYIDYKKKAKGIKLKGIAKKIRYYFDEEEKNRIDSLVSSLSKSNINTKDKLEVAINYYNSKKPLKIESSILAWLLSFVVSLASLVAVAYDNSTNTIDYQKLSVVLGSTLGIVLIGIFLTFVTKNIMSQLGFSKKKTCEDLSNDIAFIYFNYE